MTEKRSEPQEWMREAAKEIWQRFEATFPEVKAYADIGLDIPVAAIIARHAPATTGECPTCGSFVNSCGHSKMRVYQKGRADWNAPVTMVCGMCERGAVSPAPEKGKK